MNLRFLTSKASRLTRLSHTQITLAPRTGIEPVTSTVTGLRDKPLHYRSLNLVEDNGFEPFAPGCKPGVLAKYTNPPKKYNMDALLLGRLGLRLPCCSYRGAVIEALYTINGGGGWIRTTVLFKGQIYSLLQSTSLPRLQNCYTLPLCFLTRFKVAKENVCIKALYMDTYPLVSLRIENALIRTNF